MSANNMYTSYIFKTRLNINNNEQYIHVSIFLHCLEIQFNYTSDAATYI